MKTYTFTTTTFIEKKHVKRLFFNVPKNPRFPDRTQPTLALSIQQSGLGQDLGLKRCVWRSWIWKKRPCYRTGGVKLTLLHPDFVYHWENILPTLKIGIGRYWMFFLLVMQGCNPKCFRVVSSDFGKPLQDVLTLDRTDSWSADDLTGWNHGGEFW